MYWGNREKSRETFQGPWTRSGDKYMRDADGYYTYTGRSDDMLKVSGQYVSPFEVEAALVQHPAVLEAAVIGVSDGDGLTRPKAFVVLKNPGRRRRTCAEELQAFVKEQLAPYKYPRFVEFVEELPKTATGKIQRVPAARARSGRSRASAMTALISDARTCVRRIRTSAGAAGLEYRRWIAPEPRARRSSCSCTRAWARSRCGRISRPRCATAAGARGLVYLAPGLRTLDAAPRDERWARRLHARAGAPSAAGPARAARGTRRPALAVRPQRRRLDRAALRRRAFPAHVAGVVAVAPHVFVEDVSVASIDAARRLPQATGPRAAARALSRRPGFRVLRLERRLARPGVPRLEHRVRLPRIAARCWPSRATTTSTERWRRSTRSRGACRGRGCSSFRMRAFAAPGSAGGVDPRRWWRS